MPCAIKKNNKVTGISLDNGQESILFRTLKNLPFLTEDLALKMYTYILMPQFSKRAKNILVDENGEGLLVYRSLDESNDLLTTGLVFSDSFNEENKSNKDLAFGFIRAKEKKVINQTNEPTSVIEARFSEEVDALNKQDVLELNYNNGRKKWGLQNSNNFIELDRYEKNVLPNSFPGFLAHLEKLGIKLEKVEIRALEKIEEQTTQNIETDEKESIPNTSVISSTNRTEPHRLLENHFGGYAESIIAIEEGAKGVATNEARLREESPALIKFAKENNIFINNVEVELGLNYLGQPQSESHIYRDPQNKDVIIKELRSITPYNIPYKGFQSILGRILLHNYLFPETAYDIIGISEEKGVANFVLSQPYIDKAEIAFAAEIDNYMEKIGFVKDGNEGAAEFKKDGINIFDLYGGNVLKKNGSLFIIDNLIEYISKDAPFNEFIEQKIEEEVVELTENTTVPSNETIVGDIDLDQKIEFLIQSGEIVRNCRL